MGTMTACAPDPVDRAQLDQWRSDRQADIDADGPFLAVLSSESTAGQEGDRVEAVFDRPELPGAITFECFGDGTVELQLDSASTTGAANTTTTTTVEAVDCAKGPHAIDPASLGTDPIGLVGVATTNADHDTSWFLTVRAAQSTP
ncbi:hypothetical protein MT355_14585 [Rathayibacter sp. VKM Ac-2929]|uniref:hypothetical protein n=1 Tax=Rathayibacter sp. VKM Ac-2929 TaxID=2929480 RepID=UPI001FB500C4|nr:hypothetical protein [Rathayibacter sp. VKM Ac-2929]MCJ1674483.1 hypothetical protein [Rathayibacter sp. VKM Ac-2929]MCJ1684764.1 hypothetical protein [Rathayibacter sp. VKM Ac-2928]